MHHAARQNAVAAVEVTRADADPTRPEILDGEAIEIGNQALVLLTEPMQK
jgi:hypothetical protein